MTFKEIYYKEYIYLSQYSILKKIFKLLFSIDESKKNFELDIRIDKQDLSIYLYCLDHSCYDFTIFCEFNNVNNIHFFFEYGNDVFDNYADTLDEDDIVSDLEAIMKSKIIEERFFEREKFVEVNYHILRYENDEIRKESQNIRFKRIPFWKKKYLKKQIINYDPWL